MSIALKRGADTFRPPKRADILEAYYTMLEKSPAYFQQYTPRTTLEAVVKNSIIFALENPDSGEAHRIYNRLIGKPRETSININAEAQLTQSGLFLALGEIRKQFEEPAPRTVEIEAESVVEVKNELQAEKGQNDEGSTGRGRDNRAPDPTVVEGQLPDSEGDHAEEARCSPAEDSDGGPVNVRVRDDSEDQGSGARVVVQNGENGAGPLCHSGDAGEVGASGEDTCDDERPPSRWDTPPPKAAQALQKKLQEKGAKRFFQ